MRAVPLRRLGVAFVLGTSLILSLGVAAILIANARVATRAEVGTAFEMASAYLDEFRGRLSSGPRAMEEAAALARQFDQLRHVHAEVRAPDGRLLSPLLPTDGSEAAPGWFLWLVTGPSRQTSAFVTHYPNVLGTFMLETDYRDEAAEVWSDFRSVLAVILAMCSIAVIATFTVLHLVKRQLADCNRMLAAIRQGEFGTTLPRQRLAELEELAVGIRALAGELGQQNAENRLLQQRLMTLSDTERREVASDLHDGLGPLLFALRTATAEAQALLAAGVQTGAQAAPGPLGTEVAAIAHHVEALQAMVRSVIYRLRPMIHAEARLGDLLAEFAAAFAELSPQVRLRLNLGPAAALPCGETEGLAILRFVQESALNAVRHGGAGRIEIVADLAGASRVSSPALRIELCDDGRGPKAGAAPSYGQSGIMDRARALNGWYQPPQRLDGVTSTMLILPMTAQASPASPTDLSPGLAA